MARVSDYLLKEGGDKILQENGDGIFLEFEQAEPIDTISVGEDTTEERVLFLAPVDSLSAVDAAPIWVFVLSDILSDSLSIAEDDSNLLTLFRSVSETASLVENVNPSALFLNESVIGKFRHRGTVGKNTGLSIGGAL